MTNYNPLYRKHINDRNVVIPKNMVRGKFYLIKEYTYVDGEKGKFTESNGPIIFTLFVSVSKDVVHCVKVSNISPQLIKKFFGKLVNENTELLELKGTSKNVYSKYVSKVPMITDEAYRTYKITGLKKVIELDMDVDKITPKTVTVRGINAKSQTKNK